MRILVFKTGALGDVIMTTPFLRQLRKAYPTAKIDFFIGNTASIVLENNPNIDEIIRFDENIFFKKKLISWLKLIKKVKPKKYDTIFVLDKHKVFNITAKLFGIKERIGFDRLGKEGVGLTKKVYYGNEKNEIIYYLDLLKAAGKDVDYNDTNTELFLTDKPKKKDFIAVINSGGSNPGEKTKIRMMPDELFKGVIDELSKKQEIVLIGSKADGEYYNNFKFDKNITNKAGVSLKESIQLMSEAACVITTDCGPMHMAGAVNENLVCLFGPTDPKRKAPMKKGVISIWKDKDIYSPDYELFGKTPKNKDFLKRITVKEVVEAVEKCIK